jgi:hypothetical protein
MEKEIKITPPDGYEIDKANSTFDCIKFKRIEKAWRNDIHKIIHGYIIAFNSDIEKVTSCNNIEFNYNVFATEKQAKSSLAMARISQIMANDKRFGGVVTDEEWKMPSVKYVLERHGVYINKHIYHNTYHFLAFHTEEQRKLFLRENEDLVKDYLMLD